jgi:DNA-binding LacI/PurR family transcriptional regulator
MDDVAARAGVSRALVSLVMRGSPKVSAEKREAVERAAAQLGYRANAHARGLASRRTRTLGVLLSDLHNPFFAEMYDGIEQAATAAGYRVLLGTGNRRPSREESTLDSFLEHRVDGLLLLSPRLPSYAIGQVALSTPLVLVGRSTRLAGVDTVTSDDRKGAEIAVNHLIELGHRHIVHLHGGNGAGAATRRAGYERAMRAAGLDDLIQSMGCDFTEEGGAAAAEDIFDVEDGEWDVTAVFAANDLAATGVLDACAHLDVPVPQQMSVIGYDNTTFAGLHHVGLTTIDQPRFEMGRLAVELLVERLGGRVEDRHEVLEPSLVRRRTTAQPRTGTIASYDAAQAARAALRSG